MKIALAMAMKRWRHGCMVCLVIGMTLWVACTPSAQVVEPAERPSEELSAIDSLMWRQPDSAFAQLRQFVASPQADSLDEFNVHYCQLLISELLYKNYYGQSNREDLLRAVAYFDSLVRLTPHPPLKGGAQRAGDSKKISNPTPNLAFLDARAHYINGAGYYERDSVVEACKEYLMALEVMEAHFGERELVGHKARFLAYTYNRLGDLFSEQFMMESAITCYENALVYCKISPTSPIGIPNILYRIGKQYDKKNEIENASLYYGQALENMAATDNMVYRNIVASKALCDYEMNGDVKQAMDKLNYTLIHAKTEKERLNRCLTIGGVFFYERNYDSALFYLEPVFENNEAGLQTQAAGYLRIIYDSIGDVERSDNYMRFLTNQKKSDGDNKALVSKLEDLFKEYQDQKQERQVEIEREKAMKIVGGIIISIAIVALGVIIVVKRRSKTLLKKKQEEADRKLGETERQHREELEAERQTHRMEQAAMSGRLKRSNQELRELKGQIKHLDDLAAKTESATSFNEEPICRLIMERVNEGQFKSKIDYIIYKDSALDKQQLLDLRLAVDRHFGQFTARLKKAYPELTNGDLDYCCLYLLGLTDADIAALMQRTYNTVFHRNGKMRKIFGSENPLPVTLMGMAKDSSFI